MFVSQRLIFAEESGGTLSYLDETLRKALLHIKRLFDKLIVSEVVLYYACMPVSSIILFQGRKEEANAGCEISTGK